MTEVVANHREHIETHYPSRLYISVRVDDRMRQLKFAIGFRGPNVDGRESPTYFLRAENVTVERVAESEEAPILVKITDEFIKDAVGGGRVHIDIDPKLMQVSQGETLDQVNCRLGDMLPMLKELIGR